MPLHCGHEALLRFARTKVDRLYIVVDNIPHAWVSAADRCRWISYTIPDAVVMHLPEPNPQEPADHPQFWDIWRESLTTLLPEKIGVVVASEHYGTRLAQELGAKFIPYDIARKALPVSGTMIRNDVYKHWDLLAAPAQRDFTFKVCVFGPESTGKSTLTQQLARHYQTTGVSEYARDVIEAKKNIIIDDMPLIAQGQQNLIEQAIGSANRILFTDTDALATSIWTRWLFGSGHSGVEAIAEAQSCDFYLLLAPDLSWVPDSVRYFEGRGQEFFEDCRSTLERHGRAYTVIGGQGEARLQAAIAVVDQMACSFFAGTGRKSNART